MQKSTSAHEARLRLFKEQFATWPHYLITSPGRVNLMGDHTDYHQGFVLPLAIERHIKILLRPRRDKWVRISSFDFRESKAFHLDNLHPQSQRHWVEYAKGVAKQYQKQCSYGFDAVVTGDIPAGAGLASSASFELAIAKSFCLANQIPWQPLDAARKAQAAENLWVGVQCGIMDQMICAHGQEGHALMIDCRDLSHMALPLPSDALVVVMDTGTRMGLVDSSYNERRRTSFEAARALGKSHLRDIDQLSRADEQKLSAVQTKRARHIITENQRVLEATQAMKAHESETLGRLMNESHASLRSDYEVSTSHLDLMVELAQAHKACFGARLTGAGFGGAAVALVMNSEADAFCHEITAQFRQACHGAPHLFVTRATAGCHAIALPHHQEMRGRPLPSQKQTSATLNG